MCNFRLGRHSNNPSGCPGAWRRTTSAARLPGERRRAKRQELRLPSLLAPDLFLEELPLRGLLLAPLNMQAHPAPTSTGIPERDGGRRFSLKLVHFAGAM
jgi:hypothetical protein